MENLRFDGDDYKHSRDSNRLTGQLLRIWDAIKDGEWITLEELAIKSDSPAASASAQSHDAACLPLQRHRLHRREHLKQMVVACNQI